MTSGATYSFTKGWTLYVYSVFSSVSKRISALSALFHYLFLHGAWRWDMPVQKGTARKRRIWKGRNIPELRGCHTSPYEGAQLEDGSRTGKEAKASGIYASWGGGHGSGENLQRIPTTVARTDG